LLNTFGPKLTAHVSPATGRIHASFLIAATKAGRFSCRNPNLQNLPWAPEFRQSIYVSLIAFGSAGGVLRDDAVEQFDGLLVPFATAFKNLYALAAIRSGSIPTPAAGPNSKRSTISAVSSRL
jgi:hypothetical protein